MIELDGTNEVESGGQFCLPSFVIGKLHFYGDRVSLLLLPCYIARGAVAPPHRAPSIEASSLVLNAPSLNVALTIHQALRLLVTLDNVAPDLSAGGVLIFNHISQQLDGLLDGT